MAPAVYDPTSPEEQPVPLPSAPLVTLGPNIVLQPPLSRRGHGPGLIAFLPSLDSHPKDDTRRKRLDPEPVLKWAEEGFAVVGITSGSNSNIKTALDLAVTALVKLEEVDIKDKIGVLVYDPHVLSSVLDAISGESRLVCIVSYGAHSPESPVPLLSHIPNTDQHQYENTQNISCHKYTTADPLFVLPQGPHYHTGSALVAHTRSLVFLKKHIGGPNFDIEAVWDEHMYCEFVLGSVAKTMATMVAEPYVNHVPTMAGGIGREEVTAFYRDHFIFNNSTNTVFEHVSRTVGVDRIVDELICTLTHDKVLDWLLPGIAPTGRKVVIPTIGVINVRGDRLYYEHIWWDQAGVLQQIGILPTHLPYPPNGPDTVRLPVVGAEGAKLLADETAGGINKLITEQ